MFDIYSEMKVLKMLAWRAGISIKWHDKPIAYTDGKCLYLPRPLPTDTPSIRAIRRMMFPHEYGHNREGMDDWIEWMKEKKIGNKSFIGQACNLIDDYRNDQSNVFTSGYRGVEEDMDLGRAAWLVKNIANSTNKSGTAANNAITSLWLYDSYLRQDWLPSCTGLYKKHKACKESKDWFEQMRGIYDKRYNSLITIQDVEDLFWTLNREVWKIPKEKIEKDRKEAYEKQKGEKGEGEEGEKGEEGEFFDDEEAGKLIFHKHELDKDDKEKHTVPDDWNSTPGTGHPIIRKVEVRDGTKPSHTGSYYLSWRDEPSSSVSKRIQKYLLALTDSRWEGHRSKGRLDSKGLHRILSNDERVRNSIFKQKGKSLDTNACVIIANDFSGSMCGNKTTHAIKATTTLVRCLQDLHIPCYVYSFTDLSNPLHYVYKTWDHHVSEEHLAKSMSVGADTQANNADGESVLWGYHQLIQRPEKKKIMFVLSDGRPAASSHGDQHEFLKRTVKDVERAGINIFGVGIKTQYVKEYYNNHVVINNTAELDPAVVTLFKRAIV